MAATATKVCTVCSADCADRPRVKDEFGRYTCKACFDKQTRSAAAPVPKAAPKSAPKVVPPPMLHGFDDEGLDLRSAAMIESKMQPIDLPEAQSCPKCHGFMSGEQRLCMRCGYDRKRGARVTTRVEKDKDVQEERRRSASSFDPMWVVLALGLPAIGTGLWAFADPTMDWVFSISYGLFSLTTSVSVLVAQVRDKAWGYIVLMGLYMASFILPIIAVASGSMAGLAGSLLVLGLVGLIAGLCQLYWVFVESGRAYLQVAWCMCILMRLMTMGLGFAAAAQN